MLGLGVGILLSVKCADEVQSQLMGGFSGPDGVNWEGQFA